MITKYKNNLDSSPSFFKNVTYVSIYTKDPIPNNKLEMEIQTATFNANCWSF